MHTLLVQNTRQMARFGSTNVSDAHEWRNVSVLTRGHRTETTGPALDPPQEADKTIDASQHGRKAKPVRRR